MYSKNSHGSYCNYTVNMLILQNTHFILHFLIIILPCVFFKIYILIHNTIISITHNKFNSDAIICNGVSIQIP